MPLFSFLMGVSLKATGVLAVAWLGSLALRKKSASARHLLWTASGLAVLALPFLSLSLPTLTVPVGTVLLPGGTAVASGSDLAHSASSGTETGPGAVAEGTRLRAAWRIDWKICCMAVWMLGTLVGLVRLLAGCIAMSRIRRAALRFADRAVVREVAETLGIRRSVQVFETAAGSMPMAYGIWRPVVFMPCDSRTWTDERKRMVLLHELAHVFRLDVATHGLMRLALAAYWWNPLAWKAWREFLAEGERAADDLVLGTGARPSEYAGHLLDIARSMQRPPGMSVAMARCSQLESRMVAILDFGVNRRPAGRAWGIASAAVAVALMAPLAAMRGQDGVTQTFPADVDGTIRAATSQKNPGMLEEAAQAAVQSRKFDIAHRLLEAALAIRGNVSGERSREYGADVVRLGELEARQNDSSASARFERAAQILGDQPDAGSALIHLGTAALFRKEYDPAFDKFQRAQRVDPSHAEAAWMWMAVTRMHENQNPEADGLFQSALSVGDAKSMDAAVAIRVYATFLRKQNRPEEAAVLEARAAIIGKTSGRPALSPGVQRIGGGVKAPSVLSKIEPQYTDEARLAMLTGTVTLQVEIGTDGMAHHPQVMQSLGLGLDDQAIDAISQWHFEPGKRDGQAIPVAATIEINFRLL